MKEINKYISPIASFDVHLSNYHRLIDQLRRENDISHLREILSHSLTTTIVDQIKEEKYDALVLTRANQHIVWVSEGFKGMTGYSKNFVLGKRPSFLQGERTCLETKKAIRESLREKHTFEGALINYRKNKETYTCHINILPIYSKKNRLKYFLAIEKEITEENH